MSIGLLWGVVGVVGLRYTINGLGKLYASYYIVWICCDKAMTGMGGVCDKW